MAAKHWAFQPVTRPAVPEVKDGQFASHNPIDAFLAAKLAERGLAMSPPADPRTLIRRVTLDLTGLPPTPEEVEAFVNACSAANGRADKAYRTLVDRLLASPRYGERWAQHWLDVIRYADTTGYESNAIRPSAWPYRDYVIAALNADIPYPRFILEQLAGDTLGVDPATGFLVTPPFPTRIEVGQEAAAIAQARYNGLDEVVQNVGSAILGMTVGCARCHDHKFDPVSTRDYYRLAATFAGLQFVDRPWRSGSLPAEEIAAAEQRWPRFAASSSAFPAWREVEPISTADFFEPVRAKWIRLTVEDTFTGQGLRSGHRRDRGLDAGGERRAAAERRQRGGRSVARSSGPDAVPRQPRTTFSTTASVGRQSRWVARDRIDKAKAWVEIELPEPIAGSPRRLELRSRRTRATIWSPRNGAPSRHGRSKWPRSRGNGEPSCLRIADEGLADGRGRRGATTLEKQFAQAADPPLGADARLCRPVPSPRSRAMCSAAAIRMEPREPTGPGGIDVLGGYELPTDAAGSRATPRAGQVARQRAASAHRPRAGEPRLAASFRRRASSIRPATSARKASGRRIRSCSIGWPASSWPAAGS